MTKVKVLGILLLFLGIPFLVFGFIHFTGYLTDGVQIKSFDAIFNSSLGILNLMSYYFLSTKSKKALYSVGFSIFLILIYAPLVGRVVGQNLVSVILPGYIFYELTNLVKAKVLT